jgi:hypothetical protein
MLIQAVFPLVFQIPCDKARESTLDRSVAGIQSEARLMAALMNGPRFAADGSAVMIIISKVCYGYQ